MTKEERLARIVGDWLERRDGGVHVDPEEVFRAHTDLADELRARFAALDLVERAYAGEPALPEGAPRAIGEYRIVCELGRGGMGVVYEAVQEALDRRVALKVLSPAITGVAHAVKRFQREARAAARLHHTNIVPIHDMGQHAGTWYYAMELVEGRSLADVVAAMQPAAPTEERLAKASLGAPVTADSLGGTGTAGRAFFARVAEMFAQVADALQLAHEEGIIHRDVKPSNLLLDGSGSLKIVDFGLARFADDNLAMTVTGDLLATPAYMSPEQALAKRIAIDHRTDVYSLGATLYEVLTYRPPFEAETLQDLCAQIITKEPRPPRRTNARIPKDLETIVLKAMDKDRDRRYQTAREFARDLRAFAEGGAIHARRIGLAGRAWRRVKRHKVRSSLAAVALVLAAVGAALAWYAWQESSRRAELEYVALCGRGFDEAVRTGDPDDRALLPDRDGGCPFDEAIALLPGRPEAYFGRALQPGRSPRERLADVEAAFARGLSARAYHLTRAEIFRIEGEWDRVREEERLAAPFSSDAPVDRVVEGRLLRTQGRYEEATSHFDDVIAADGGSGPVALLARRARADIRDRTGDHQGALEDLLVVRAGGDRSPATGLRIALAWKRLGQGEAAEAALRRTLDETATEGTVGAWRRLCSGAHYAGDPVVRDRVTRAAVAAHPHSAQLACSRATCLGRAGRHEEARAVAEAAIRQSPDDCQAHWALARAHFYAGRDAPALSANEQALRLASPRQVSSLRLDRAYLLGRMGRSEEAREIYRELLAEDPYDSIVLEHLGSLLETIGDLVGACEMFDRAIAIEPCNAGLHYGRGRALQLRGEWAGARDAYDRAIRLRPDWAPPYACRADVQCELGENEAALASLDEAIRLDPTMSVAWLKKGAILRFLGRHESALAASREVLRLGTERPAVAHNLAGQSLYSLGRIEEAAAALREALELDPDYLEARNGLVTVAIAQGRYEAALRACDRADPNAAATHGNRGIALLNLGRCEEALAACDRALELDPDLAVAHHARGRALLGLGRLDDALAAIDRALALDSTLAEAHGDRGTLLANRFGRFEEALASFDRALALDPTLARASVNRASVLCSLDRHDEALAAVDHALGIAPDEAPAHQMRGYVLHVLGRPGDSVAAYERALELGLPAPRLAAGVARIRATSPDPGVRDVTRAMELARLAVRLGPEVGEAWTALGIALQRQGDLAGCARALERAMALRGGGDAYDWYFLALALHGLGHMEKAREFLDRAVAWTDEHAPGNEELARFRAEAEGVLGIERE